MAYQCINYMILSTTVRTFHGLNCFSHDICATNLKHTKILQNFWLTLVTMFSLYSKMYIPLLNYYFNISKGKKNAYFCLYFLNI